MRGRIKVMPIIVFLIIVIGGTYAWLQLTVNGTATNTLHAGSLVLSLDELTTQGINIEEAVPISDSKGLETTEYTFSLKNESSSTDASYEIHLDDIKIDDGKSRMDDKYVKYSLTKNGSETTTQLLNSIGQNPNRILDSGTLEKGKTNTYSLRVWIDYDADNGAMGTEFKAGLRIEAIQSNAIRN